MIPTIFRNFAVLSVGQLATRVLSFFVTIHLTRVLGDEGFGIITFSTGVLIFGTLLIGFGFDALGSREVAREQIAMPELVNTVVGWRLLLVIPAFLGMALFASLATVSDTTKLVLMLYALSLLADAVDLGWAFLGAERMPPVALAETAGQGVLAVLMFWLIRTPEQVVLVPLGFLAGRVIHVTILAITYRRQFTRLRPKLDRPLLRRLLPPALPFAGSRAISMTLANFDIIILGLWLTSTATGHYGAAYRIVWLPIMFVQSYYISIRPTIARAYVTGLEPAMPFVNQSTKFMVAMGLGITVGGIMLAHPIVAFLFLPEFAPAGTPLQILLLTFFLQTANGHYRSLLMSFNHQVTELRINGLAALTNIVLNLLLIPTYEIAGAAFATLVARIVIIGLSYLATRRLIRPVSLIRHLPKPIICAALMALTLGFTPALHLIPRTLLGGSVYLVSLLALRVITLQEIQTTLQTFLPKSQ